MDTGKYFIQGFVCAVACTIKEHGMRTEVVDLWRNIQCTIADLINNEVEESDIDILRQHWEELNR